jgi:hypothetical protein
VAKTFDWTKENKDPAKVAEQFAKLGIQYFPNA